MDRISTMRWITASTVEDEEGKRYSIFPKMTPEEEKALRESPGYHHPTPGPDPWAD